MECSKKIVSQQKYENFGIWNFPGVIKQKIVSQKNINFVIRIGIFQKCITTPGGVFNQDI